jgi:hypothetical protein
MKVYVARSGGHKVSLNANFMSQFLTHLYFGNSVEEFHPHETLSTPIKLL